MPANWTDSGGRLSLLSGGVPVTFVQVDFRKSSPRRGFNRGQNDWRRKPGCAREEFPQIGRDARDSSVFWSTLGASGAFDYMDSNTAAGQAGDWSMKIRREPAPDARREAFDVIWRGLRVQMARLVTAMGIGPHQIEDVLQDVYLSAWRKPPARS